MSVANNRRTKCHIILTAVNENVKLYAILKEKNDFLEPVYCVTGYTVCSTV